MEAELRNAAIATQVRPGMRQSWRDVVFTVSHARRALPYIARIAEDAAEAFRVVQESRTALGEVVVIANRQLRRELCERRDRALRRLDIAIDDCNVVGAHLIDIPEGKVSLPAEIEDRPVCLLWRLGDDVAGAWSELGG